MLAENKYGNFHQKITQNYLKITLFLPWITQNYHDVTHILPENKPYIISPNLSNETLRICRYILTDIS